MSTATINKKPTSKTARRRGHAMLLWNVPPDLRLQFHMACMAKETTMTDVLVKCMKDYVVKNG